MLRRLDEGSARYRYFQTKYRELREQFTTLRNCYYLIECAWCKRHIRWKRREGAMPGGTSHGICPPCAAAMVREMQAREMRPMALSIFLGEAWESLSAVVALVA
jgi:hypothetical protein